MKRIILRLGLVIAAIAVFLFVIPHWQGYEKIDRTDIVYPIKKWSRSLRGFFEFREESQIRGSFTRINEFFKEWRAQFDVGKGYNGGLEEYMTEVTRATELLMAPELEFREDERRNFIKLLLNHLNFFSGLEGESNQEELELGAQDVYVGVNNLLAIIVGLGNQDIFVEVIEEKVSNSGVVSLSDFKAGELSISVARLSAAEDYSQLLREKENAFLQFAGRLEGMFLPTREKVMRNLGRGVFVLSDRLQAIDAVRELVFSPEIKSELNILRQQILRDAETKKDITKEGANNAYHSTEKFITELDEEIDKREGDVSPATLEAHERAHFHFEQAGDFLEAAAYASAVGQSISAAIISQNVLVPLQTRKEEYKVDLTVLQQAHDRLNKEREEVALNDVVYRERLNAWLDETELRIIELVAFVEEGSAEEIVLKTRTIKLLLAAAEQIIQEVKN